MQKSNLVTLFDSAVANASSGSMLVEDYDTIIIQYSAWGATTTAAIKFQGSISDDAPVRS